METKALTKTKKSSTAASVTNGIIDLPGLEAQLDKVWNMFLRQTERNTQLMAMLQHQQESAISFPAASVPVPVEQKEIVPHFASLNVPEVTLSKLKTLEPLMRIVIHNPQKRFGAVQTLINMVHILYHLNGEAYPEQLFGLVAISQSGGYRLLSDLRMGGVANVKNGKIVLTDFGRRLYDGNLTEEEMTAHRNRHIYG